MLSLLLSHGLATAGGMLMKKLRVPAGAMIGALLSVALLNNLTGESTAYPSALRTGMQVLSGAIIGCRVTRDDFRGMKSMLLPIVTLLTLLLGLNVLFALLIARVSPLGIMTALLAAAPGGVTDLALIAADFGADTEIVTLLQLVRFVFVIILLPPIIKKLLGKQMGSAWANAAPASRLPPPQASSLQKATPQQWGQLAVTLACAALLGVALKWLRWPAGAVIGGMAGAILVNLTKLGTYFPRWLKTVVQLMAGCYIGGQVTRHVVLSLSGLWLPVLLILAEVLVMTFGTAAVLHAVCKICWPTSVFSSTPGGVAEMGVIAEELGLDTPKIVLMHTCRLMMVICMLPLLMRLFAAG